MARALSRSAMVRPMWSGEWVGGRWVMMRPMWPGGWVGWHWVVIGVLMGCSKTRGTGEVRKRVGGGGRVGGTRVHRAHINSITVTGA